MLNAGGSKGIGKSSQRKGKTERQGRKAETRKQAGEPQDLEAEPKPYQLQHAEEQISAPVASMEISRTGRVDGDLST